MASRGMCMMQMHHFSTKSVDGLPLFIGMPRRVLLGNAVSGIPNSRYLN
jgi:hypothetical protein